MSAVLTRTLLACCATTAAIHLASIVLNTLLPFHIVRLGGSKTQIGLLFSVMTVVSMVLRPLVGGWVDRFGVRPVIVPGIVTLAATSLALHLASTPVAIIVLMTGVGLSNGLVSTTTSVLASRAAPEHRGEALNMYYLASSLAIAIAPPLAFGLSRAGGMSLVFVVVTVLAAAMIAIALSLPAGARAPVPGAARGLRMFSPGAIPVSFAMALTTIGHSSLYAFLPLYAISQGHGNVVVWYFTIQSLWLIVCRAGMRGLSDRIGRTRVVIPAMAVQVLGYAVLTLPPTLGVLVVSALFLGTGGALLYPTLAALVVERAPEPERGLALGTLSGSWDLGVVVGSVLIGAVVERASYGAGFAVATGGAILGLVAFLLADRRWARVAVVARPALAPRA